MTRPTIHIIGAGLAGLSAAIDLAPTGARIIVYEAAKAAGGRCRSYFDQRLGMEIDNGNHLLLSGNSHALAYVKSIGAEDRVTCFSDACFHFVDLSKAIRWTIDPSRGPLALWGLPGVELRDHLGLLKLISARSDVPLRDLVRCEGRFYQDMLRPLLLAALNTEPARSSSVLAGAILRATLFKGAKACRPITIREGLSRALVDPALLLLERFNAEIHFSKRLHSMRFSQRKVAALQFDEDCIELNPADMVILAVPASAAAALAPWLEAPNQFNAIVNAHFAVTPPPTLPAITAVNGATTEWLFAYERRLSVTVSAANHLLALDADALAREIWREASTIAGISTALPAWRIVREKRATFAATPEQNKRRPSTRTAYANLLLAGDWTATGLPATIEGAIKSGVEAAYAARRQMTRAHSAPNRFFRQRKTHAHAHHG